MKKYRDLLLAMIKEKNYSKSRLALEIGITRKALSNFLSGKNCKLITIGSIYKYLKETGAV